MKRQVSGSFASLARVGNPCHRQAIRLLAHHGNSLLFTFDGVLYLGTPSGTETNVIRHSLLRRMLRSDFENLLDALTARQYVAPHEPVAAALASTVDELGVCPNAIEQALAWLQIDPQQAIGRLRRTEMMQLARTVHRYWRQAQPGPAASERQRQ